MILARRALGASGLLELGIVDLTPFWFSEALLDEYRNERRASDVHCLAHNVRLAPEPNIALEGELAP